MRAWKKIWFFKLNAHTIYIAYTSEFMDAVYILNFSSHKPGNITMKQSHHNLKCNLCIETARRCIEMKRQQSLWNPIFQKNLSSNLLRENLILI